MNKTETVELRRSLVKTLAQALVEERKLWEVCNAEEWTNKQREREYKSFVRENEFLKWETAGALAILGVPVYTVTISGCAASSAPSNYDLEELVLEKFGDQVRGDSEHSQLFIYATPAVAEEVLAYVREVGKAGEKYSTYGAGDFEAEFHASRSVSPWIPNLNSWDQAEKVLQKLEYLELQEKLDRAG